MAAGALAVTGVALAAGTGAAAGPRAVPILMYHAIGDPPAGTPYPELYVRRADFAGQVEWLARHGFHPVTLRALYDHWTRRTPLPRRPVVLTFDDGYRSVATAAFPVLRRERWPGVVNVEIRFIGTAWGLRRGDLSRLAAAGWEIDSHTITHPDLTGVDDAQLRIEIAGSRAALQRLGYPSDFLCYPAGRYDARVIAAAQRAGYLGATTTEYGLARSGDPFSLDRVRVDRSDGIAGLANRLRALGALD